MPRPGPGPRPYECVRRAWHSDRHQPIRGSVIQQIFRVLHESHSPATKKNKEWQEKLPIVVLKAEEIMYSKANSEAEYMDFQTLWERVNDAINTIIRRDESSETGDLLLPCVEAALYLGCVPVRASRSQRHSNPRSYLSPTPEENICSSSKLTENPPKTQNLQLPPSRPISMNPPRLLAIPVKDLSPNSSFRSKNSSNVGSAYPLYYGKHPKISTFPFQIPRNSNQIFVGTPIYPSMTEPPRVGSFHNQVSETISKKNHEKESEPGFDLSLRLGLFQEPCLEKDHHVVDHEINKEFSFFPVETSNDPSGFGTSRWRFEGEGHGVGPSVKKRKAPFDINL